jgi:hypothetical protein
MAIENISDNFDWISLIYWDHVSKEICIDGIFRKITVHVPGTQRRNVSFLETGFLGITNLIVVSYSEINNGLLSNNRFRYVVTEIEAGA